VIADRLTVLGHGAENVDESQHVAPLM
jgi:hypothetical protein